MVWGAIGMKHKAGPVIFQNIGPGRGNGVMARRYINQVLRLHIVLYFGRHQHHMFQQDTAHAHTARATGYFLQQHNIRIMSWSALSPDLNPIEHIKGRNSRKTQWSVTKADNCTRSECSYSQDICRDSKGLSKPPYSIHVQEKRVCGQCS